MHDFFALRDSPFSLLLFACWVAYYEREEPFGLEGLAASLFSGAFVALGLGAMTSLRCMERGNLLVLAPLVVTMLGDSGAYFAGRGLGKRKMSPRTSPNKTLAGLVGGLLASALGMVIYGLVLRAFGLSGSLWKLGGGAAGGPELFPHQAPCRSQGLRQSAARPRRGLRPLRQRFLRRAHGAGAAEAAGGVLTWP